MNEQEQKRNLGIFFVLFFLALSLLGMFYTYKVREQSKPKPPAQDTMIGNTKYIVK